ncbi:MAG: aspartate-semialdehyde dehydrogenase [Phycisphaerae bacterium]|nr:aspartate-semialdehyde dehydrogenase [Phycisphaerae bacterium]MCZ2398343.1 aspartate-semialdehyde dehydrogenase [Phycisphaerae bacterium]
MNTIAIVGATGAVGREFAVVLGQRGWRPRRWRLLASPRSAGQTIRWIDGEQCVEALTPEALRGVDLALFSAGGSISREYAPAAAAGGTLVIDNSSAFRMDAGVPLVVPEINPEAARRHRGIIANPNCSTIILALVLWPLHRACPVQRVIVSTYQAVSGAGARALAELESQTRDVLAGREPRPQVFPAPCAFNVFSHNSPLDDDGYNLEETKMLHETRKIFGDDSLRISATCMRVPVRRAHTETVAVEFARPISPDAARDILSSAPGVRVVDDRRSQRFPTPLEASGIDEVLVGRIRQDLSLPDGRGLKLVCAGDQLRKGAALNAVQIAELLR